MKIEFLQDVAQKEPKLVIVAADYNRDVQALSDQLERLYSKTVNGYTEERVQILSQADILRIYAEGQHVFCQTADGIYILRSRLYEMEATLDSQMFVRISKFELVN
ncbi:MAG: LytTR family transcriptional regulator, partial [Clostridia bacterium]|nr:LytTR family transcriptional regulator [Clostridia bacterium]